MDFSLSYKIHKVGWQNMYLVVKICLWMLPKSAKVTCLIVRHYLIKLLSPASFTIIIVVDNCRTIFLGSFFYITLNWAVNFLFKFLRLLFFLFPSFCCLQLLYLCFNLFSSLLLFILFFFSFTFHFHYSHLF